MDPHSPHKLFATKYCFLIPGDDTSFFFFISFFFGFLLFYVIISFYKFILLLLLLFFFFHENYFLFFHVQECSRMFRNVPCSRFYRRPLETQNKKNKPKKCSVQYFLNCSYRLGRLKRQQTSDKLRFLHRSYMRAKQNGGLLLREKQARQLSTCWSKLLTAKRYSHRLTIEPWNHGTKNLKSLKKGWRMVFASISSTAIFLRARAEIKNLLCEQRALLIFAACSNPYGNPFL